MTETGIRFVAEMILNKDGEIIQGTVNNSHTSEPLSRLVGLQAKIVRGSNGLMLTDFQPIGEPAISAKMTELMDIYNFIPKPMFTGEISKKLKIVLNCKITGFYLGEFRPPKDRVDISKIKKSAIDGE